MNILIVSRDIFFISGVIALVTEAWQPHFKTHPVFLVSGKGENPLLLEPDVIISDETSMERGLRNRSDLQSARFSKRFVAVFLAAQHKECRDVCCTKHHLYLRKKESAMQLSMLFGSQKFSGFLSTSSLLPTLQRSSQQQIVLSKQQAMVVRYTRQGLSLTDISHLTQLSVKTISTHKRAIMRKLGMKNNSEFYQYTLADFIPR